jgi:acid stress-induced BolA-like protein IbaG/YrbA
VEISQIVKETIEKKLSGSEVVVRAFAGSDHLEADIVWSGFKGLGKIEQHQKVYDAIKDLMKEQVHALTMKTWVEKPRN